MHGQYTYLFVVVLCLLFPLIFSFTKRYNFISEWKYFFISNLITAFLFVIWDIIYTSINVWTFNPKYILGVSFSGLPLEEYLFFICIPYAFMFTYHSFSKYFQFNSSRLFNIIQWFVITALICISIIFYHKVYTSVTFFLLALLLTVLKIKRVTYLPLFYATYAVILLPFFIANGILTGGIINRMVVIYNNQYNLGIRIYTIPVEDIFYGMLLLMLNTAIYEHFKSVQNIVDKPSIYH